MTLEPPSSNAGQSATGAVRSARSRYRSNGSITSPGRAVVLLYERLLRDLDDAATALAGGDRATAHHPLIHAQQLVDGLDAALDVEVWPAAAGLRDLYDYVGRLLVEANLAGDRAKVEECRRILEPLASAWAEAWAATASEGAGHAHPR